MVGVFDRIPDVRCEYSAPIEVGTWVAVLSVVPNWRVEGRRQEMRWLEVFHVMDGKIKGCGSTTRSAPTSSSG